MIFSEKKPPNERAEVIVVLYYHILLFDWHTCKNKNKNKSEKEYIYVLNKDTDKWGFILLEI